MDRIEELISKLCPNGVPFVSIGDLIERAPKSQFGVGAIESMASGNVVAFTSGNKRFYVDSYLVDGEYIFMNDGGVADTKYHNGKAFYSDHVFAFTSKLMDVRFLFHYLLKINNIINKDYFRGGGIKNLVKKDFLTLKIPNPPITIQNEIVNILDQFSKLIGKLKDELLIRKNQYQFYLDRLYESVDKKYIVKLGSFSRIVRGGNFQKKDFIEDGYPCIHYGQMYTHFGVFTDNVLTHLNKDVFDASKKAHKNDIVMAVTSENVEDVCTSVAWLGDDEIAVSGHTAIISHGQNAKYLSYFFRSNLFFKQKAKLAHGTKVIEVTPAKMVDVLIPVPPLDVQESIVEKLDNFYLLVFDAKFSIPAEISNRQKQYEYYRDKLLSFKELKA